MQVLSSSKGWPHSPKSKPKSPSKWCLCSHPKLYPRENSHVQENHLQTCLIRGICLFPEGYLMVRHNYSIWISHLRLDLLAAMEALGNRVGAIAIGCQGPLRLDWRFLPTAELLFIGLTFKHLGCQKLGDGTLGLTFCRCICQPSGLLPNYRPPYVSEPGSSLSGLVKKRCKKTIENIH